MTPCAPGLARKTIASATSCGSPPWPSALRRRATSRMATGIAAVRRVSMNPGATALTVTPRVGEALGASARTQPTIPAFDAA